jgi:hypothetical protein
MIAQLEHSQTMVLDGAPTALSLQEKVRLHQLERIVETNFKGFLEAGKALSEIRSSRLYRERYSTFESYVRERWGLARSSADQLVRATGCAQMLLETTGAPDGDTPLPPNIAEITLRPISQLPDPDLQSQVWRLVSLASPDGKPTHTICAKVVRLIKETLNEAQHGGNGDSSAKALPPRETMFVRPIQRLSRIDNFDPDIAVLHVKDPEQARRIVEACETVIARCAQIETKLAKKFPSHVTGSA